MASLALLMDQTTWGKNLRNAIHDYQDTDPNLLAEEEDFGIMFNRPIQLPHLSLI